MLDELVAHGWTDGVMRRIDGERVMQLVSPRRTQPWEQSYEDRADRLAAFPPSTRRNVLRWIASAKRAETRATRVLATATEAQQGRRVASNG